MRWIRGGAAVARLSALFGLCGALGSACGGSTGGGGANSSGPIAAGDLPGALADAYCGAIAPCCTSVGVPVDGSICRQFMSAQMKASLDAARPENYVYDAEAAGECVTAMRRIGGDDCSGFSTTSPTAVGACDEIFTGRLEPGASCTSDIECASDPGVDANCDIESDCVTAPDGTTECTPGSSGTCSADQPRGVEGDPCYWTCTQDGTAESCSGNTSLEEGPGQSKCYTNDNFYCADSGVCTAQSSLGGPCDSDEMCAGETHCDFASRTCIPLSGAGEVCTFTSDCGAGLYCKNDVCVPELAPGSPCDDFSDECRDGYCDAGTCVQNGDLGDVGIALACAFLAGGVLQPQ